MYMKGIFIVLLLSCISSSLWAQKNFEWDVIVDSPQNKVELLEQIKRFITEEWQIEDKEIMLEDISKGVIVTKGKLQISSVRNLVMFTHKIEYAAKFYAKDKKARIVIDNVNCVSTIQPHLGGNLEGVKPPISDTYPEKNGKKITGMSKKKYIQMMEELKADIQKTVDSYVEFMSSNPDSNIDW